MTSPSTTRRKTRTVHVGKIQTGGDAAISIQSMTTTDTEDLDASLAQITQLADAGCDIIRVAVPHMRAAKALGNIKKNIDIPLVADIHFDARLAIESINQGVDKIRINPGNIRDKTGIEKIVRAAAEKNVAIRIGVNSGSIRPRSKDGVPDGNDDLVKMMVDTTLAYCEDFEKWDFKNIVLSLKTADPLTTIQAYREIAPQCDYPLHIGLTSAGSGHAGMIRSSVALGSLLLDGIGDTIRVSLTGDPVDEITSGLHILRATGQCKKGIEMISCPTCGRCQVPLIDVAQQVEKESAGIKKHLKVAVMGCVVNGPGEAMDADVGIASGKGYGYLFKHGKKIKKVPESEMAETLIQEIKNMATE